ncbi:MAG: membrane protein insertase YidC [Lachnospiraceae bacterium]|nr:membrane protein insertase YidC [Lachnospiraceae bacterium]
MVYVAKVFGFILSLSYKLSLDNYILAIIIFTAISKVILLPVSIWTQKNSIKMVKLQPKLNMIKVNYFGDRDKIADETTDLYKQEKYNPFAGIIPMCIQIVILLGIIEVVRHPEYANLSEAEMVVGNIEFYLHPYSAGGLYWLMPLFAGVSALILSFAQLRMNPLQAEQSKSGQIGTTAFSVGISLILGIFVPAGVGLYWICSNLLTIFQQFILNHIIDPHKYIDHAALEESRRQLNELQNIGAPVKGMRRNPYASKEKADYKRFFSVANKHIVFYSEKNGFYKYFEKVIDYLLQHSNLTIHYITSDPKDNIFEMEKENKRIRGYYIGEKRLIPLMMKMDADMVVMTMPDLDNYHIKRSYVRKDVEYVYICHYPLSTHMVLHTGSFDHYDTFLCVGEFQIPEIRKQEELYNLPAKKLVLAGYGQLEKLKDQYDAMEKVDRSRKKILIAPSWQEENILESCIDKLLSELLGKGADVYVRPHPEFVKRYGYKVDAIVERYKDYAGDDLHFELDFTTNTSLFDSDVAITDWSGTAYEFSFVTGKPAVFVDTKMKVKNPEYVKLGIEPLEIKLRDEVGIRLDPKNLDGAYEKITELFNKQEEYIKKNIELRNRYIYNFGHSGELGGKYIIDSLKKKAENRKKADN